MWCPLTPIHPFTLGCHLPPAGREGREGFGAKSGLKKKKTGGLSNREKDKRKRLPFAARSGQVGRQREWEAGVGKRGIGGIELEGMLHAEGWRRWCEWLACACWHRAGAEQPGRGMSVRVVARATNRPPYYWNAAALRLWAQVKKRLVRHKLKSNKNFKGHARN